MPPVNTPTETPLLGSEEASPYLRQLEAISSPVPDLAATLTTQVEEDAATGSMSYLRTRLPDSLPRQSSRDPRNRQPYLTEDEFRHFTSESRQRMLRNLDMDHGGAQIRAAVDGPYSTSNPSTRRSLRQSVYGWAPGSDEEEDQHQLYRFDVLNRPQEHLPISEQAEWRDVQRELEAHRAARHRPRREPRDEPSGRATLPYWSDYLRNDSSSPRIGEPSSASAALLQSVERHRRYNARARSTMQGFILDRDRLNHESAPQRDTNYSRLHRSEHTRGTSPYYLGQAAPSHADLRAAHRQMFLDNPILTRLKNMIKYLSDLRHCISVEDGLSIAADLGVYKDNAPYKASDLILETSTLTPPGPSSWLMRGTVFRGDQHAMQGYPAFMLIRDRERLQRIITHDMLALDPSEIRVPSSLLTLTNAHRYTSDIAQHSSQSPHPQQHLDHWPVSVTLDSVDLGRMTVTGTMSASHIPDKLNPTSPDHKSEGNSMKSYFEGEIIDFNTHSLQTEHFRSDGVETDVTYWRQLGPFRELCAKAGENGEDEMVRCLGSREWVHNVLMRNWVLMRWKERCFINESNPGWGLMTISGFYYVALERSTGRIEGLYYDPGSQPYQQLSMMPEGTREGSAGGVKKWFPALDFA